MDVVDYKTYQQVDINSAYKLQIDILNNDFYAATARFIPNLEFPEGIPICNLTITNNETFIINYITKLSDITNYSEKILQITTPQISNTNKISFVDDFINKLMDGINHDNLQYTLQSKIKMAKGCSTACPYIVGFAIAMFVNISLLMNNPNRP